MSDAATAAAFRRLAQALHDDARTHKRLERHHRRQAQDTKQRLDELFATCQRLGIRIQIDTAPKEAQSS